MGINNCRAHIVGLPLTLPSPSGGEGKKGSPSTSSGRRGLCHAILAVHPVQDLLLALGEVGGVLDRIVPSWGGEQRGEQGRLFLRQFGSRFPEVMARRRLGAENPVAPLRDIQVELQDSFLGEAPLELPSDQRLVRFAQEPFLRRKKEVLRELLCDRAPTALQLPLLPIARDRVLAALPLKPVVLVEIG